MRSWLIFSLCLCACVCGARSSNLIQDQVGSPSHHHHGWESYAVAPGGGGGGWGPPPPQPTTSGSYYHYHVPLVGGGGGWGGGHEASSSSKGHILLWALAGLLALALLGSLLLPLFLLPLGLSLLALLMPMMMMAAGMMMMMMMMMMPQNPLPSSALSRSELVGRAIDTVGKMVKGDTEGAINNILSTMEIAEDLCPEVAICNLGQKLQESQPIFEKLHLSPLDLLNKGKQLLLPLKGQQGSRDKFVRRLEKSFITGLSMGSCEKFEKRCRRLKTLRESTVANTTSSSSRISSSTQTLETAPENSELLQQHQEQQSPPLLSFPLLSTPTIKM